MGISEIQKKRVFEEVTRNFFASGEKPSLRDILAVLSEYFDDHPVGLPLSLPLEYLTEDMTSDVDKFNTIMGRMSLNLDVLYESNYEQVKDIMTLTTLLRSNLEKLRNKRNKIIATLDDHLFSLYNTDGYYFSRSDVFSDLDLVDLSLTNAFINTTVGEVTIPVVSNLSNQLAASEYSAVSLSAVFDGVQSSVDTVSPFAGCIDGLTNTIWSSEIQTLTKGEAVMSVTLDVGSNNRPVTVSKIDFDPYGISPVQAFVEVSTANDPLGTFVDFGSQIKTSLYKMSFVSAPLDVTQIRITLRKSEPDYTITESGTTKYRYIFGAKNISVIEQVYDSEATLVSSPLAISTVLSEDNVIDAVSLSAIDEIPEGTDIKYYVAADTGLVNPEIGDFDWKRIFPIDEADKSKSGIVRFDGARSFVKYIRSNPNTSELQLIPLDNTNRDLTKRNPSAVVVSGADIYRLASFKDTKVLPSSLRLEEGVNTTRILYTGLKPAAVQGLDYWAPYVNGSSTSSYVYGRIDSGNEFFYGGDIGESGKSVYVETYLESLEDQNLILKEFKKIDPNSKVWDVVVYLNGVKVGSLPIGTDSLVIPWKFNQGLNHVVLTINIPKSSGAYPNPYIGLVDLMGGSDLFDFGTVKLATWSYVDIFAMQYNEVDSPYTFTMYNDEIVSRRKPTSNFRLTYSQATNSAPGSIRVRADLSRSGSNQFVTPIIDSYRLRFLYANR